jgi:hypothetical protein
MQRKVNKSGWQRLRAISERRAAAFCSRSLVVGFICVALSPPQNLVYQPAAAIARFLAISILGMIAAGGKFYDRPRQKKCFTAHIAHTVKEAKLHTVKKSSFFVQLCF